MIDKYFNCFQQQKKKNSYHLQNQEFQEWQSEVLKLVILRYFENIELIPTIKI